MTEHPVNLDYGKESIITKSSDESLQVRVPAYPTDCDYFRVVRLEGENVHELAYWNKDEWQDDPDLECIGAITGAIKQVSDGTWHG